MVDCYIVDTHALLWYFEGSQRFGPNARQILNDPNARLWLPITALAEAFFILEKGRTGLTISEAELASILSGDSRFRIVGMGKWVLMKSLDCKVIPEMHDRQIVATALLAEEAGFAVAILTRDGNITQSGFVPCVW